MLGLCLALSGCIGGHCDDHPFLGVFIFLGIVVVGIVGWIVIRND
jgi:hypothetical protein